MGRRSSIDSLPTEVRRWLERALTENNFSGYARLEALLKEKGYVITRSSLQRFGYKWSDNWPASAPPPRPRV